MFRSRRPLRRVLPGLLILLVFACRHRDQEIPAHHGPIVLITIDALRADEVGAFGGPSGLTPNLDSLARQATWAGRAVSPASWTVPSMAALFSGLQPWRNQTWTGDQAVLRPDLVTIPEALKARGFRTSGFRSNHWLSERFGYNQGFDSFRYFREGKRAEAELAHLDGGAQFVWIHILPPHAPYVRRAPLLGQLPPGAPKDLPPKVRPLDLEPYFDPSVPLPPEQAKVFRAMYDLNAAWADNLLGRMVSALSRSGQWDKTLLVVTADHGEEFGESHQIAHGGNLGRQLIEVPLMIKLPAGFQRRLAIQPGHRPATIRVRATLIEAAGGKRESFTAPSLFEKSDAGALSELYLGNGVNRFSLVEGDRQLLWESQFAPPEPEYYRARFAGIGGKPEPPLSEPSAAIFKRLEDAFAKALPLTGLRGAPPRLTLWQWTGEHGSRQIQDAATMAAMARRLKTAWVTVNGPEKPPGRGKGQSPQLTPEEEQELRNLGYVAGGN